MKTVKFIDTVDWFRVGVVAIVIVVVTVLVGGIAWSVIDENQWKKHCTDRHGFIIQTRGNGTACVDSERRIIE